MGVHEMTIQKREIKEIRHFFLAEDSSVCEEDRSVYVNENYEFGTQMVNRCVSRAQRIGTAPSRIDSESKLSVGRWPGCSSAS
jgi:hypothetical protein